MAARLRAMGVPEHLIEKQCNARTDFPVWPENDSAVRVFCALAATQWNVTGAGMGGLAFIGLRYEALPVVFELLAVPASERAEAFAGLRVMEREALTHFNRPG